MPKDNKKSGKQAESLLIIRPVAKGLGLDYLHVTLIVLVIVLVALAFSLANFKQGVFVQSCQYGTYNGTCAKPIHNSSTALAAAEAVLASYGSVNSSLSLLPYYSLPGEANVSYISNSSEWLVNIPYLDPLLNNSRFYFSMLLYDSNLSLAMSFVQTVPPTIKTDDQAVALGVVDIYGKANCTDTTPIPVYDILDPYAPGAVQSIFTGINASQRYGGKVNITYKFVATSYTDKFLAGYGTTTTGTMGASLFCASLQPSRFSAYMHNFSILYTGAPLLNSTLSQVAQGSGLNMTEYASCFSNSTEPLVNQAKLAQFYGVYTTPTFIVNCRYQTIPQQLDSAINYALNGT